MMIQESLIIDFMQILKHLYGTYVCVMIDR